jgi:hypothetical protein
VGAVQAVGLEEEAAKDGGDCQVLAVGQVDNVCGRHGGDDDGGVGRSSETARGECLSQAVDILYKLRGSREKHRVPRYVGDSLGRLGELTDPAGQKVLLIGQVIVSNVNVRERDMLRGASYYRPLPSCASRVLPASRKPQAASG